VNVAKIWLRDPAQLDAVLVQARATGYGLHGQRFITRSGVRVLLDQAAGIVIALLGALSVIALLTAGVMLAAAARAEVQRRLRAIGVSRAIGSTRGHVALISALETLIVAVPAAGLGVAVGALVASGPDDRLLTLLNERGPGGALWLPLLGCLAVATLLPLLTGTWPAWRATGRPPVELLRGAELHATGHSASRPRRGGLARLGARLVAARRVRLAATLAMLGISAAFVLLMLALASELSTLENDPASLGRRYQLTASLPPSATDQIRRIPGVTAAAPRYQLTAVDSFALGETVDVIAYPGDHVTFESPPLVAGRRLRGTGEAEVGSGLAQALGLSVSSTLALALPSGAELRLRVAGIVSALDHDGRVAYVPASALPAHDPAADEEIAIRLRPGADAAGVASRLGGASVSRTRTITGNGNALVSALTAVLRAVAVIDGLVCLYTLIQALALTAQERRGTIAVLRAAGAGRGAVGSLLAGAALTVVAPAALVAVALERLVLGPEMGHIAAGYASLALSAGPGEIALVVVGLALLAAVAVWWVARRACREQIVAGLP
jgi:ABC-type lipoprotein release transport system permease subunit